MSTLNHSFHPSPLAPLAVDGLDYHGERHTGSRSGRSFFGFMPLANALALHVGEVTGSGTPAEILTSGIRASLPNLAAIHGEDVGGAVHELNRILFDISPEGYLTTLFYGHVDTRRRELRYVNAGHDPALLFRRSANRMEPLENTGTVLGLSGRASYRLRTNTLEAGDTLVAVSDGLDDYASGTRRLWQACAMGALHLHPNASATDLARYMLDAVDHMQPGIIQAQEISLIVVRFTGAGMAVRIAHLPPQVLTARAA